LYFTVILARESMYAERAMLSPVHLTVRLCVCLSVTPVDQSKTVEVRIMQLSPQSSPIALVFLRYKFNPKILTGSPLAEASNKGGWRKLAIF